MNRYNDGTICLRYSTCSRSGFTESFKNENINVNFSDVKKMITSSKKNGCLAVSKFKNLRCSLMFYIYVFVEDHNHELLHLLRINRTINFLDESFIYKVGTCKIGASKAYNLVSSMKGDFDSRGGTAVDFKNFHIDFSSKFGVKDSRMVVDIMINIKLCFSNFSFEVQTDVDDHLTGLFYVDDTSKANYKEFRDVLSFDATYQTKNLLARETTDAYVWLLEEFCKAFFKPPMMIVTDQDSSVKKVVNFIFPKSKHRLCMWHITQKLEEKIHINVITIQTSKRHFLILDLWIPAYVRDLELSSLKRTTSISKSLNYAFSYFLHHKSNLVKFMMSFDSVMEKQRHHQSLLYYQCTTTIPKLRTHLAIEKHASKIYTHNIFLDIQKELYKSVFIVFKNIEVYVLRDKKKKKLIDKNVNKDEDSDDFYRNSLHSHCPNTHYKISMEYEMRKKYHSRWIVKKNNTRIIIKAVKMNA
uniref:MULE transposase domain-containing protein n=1 Tax=Lactuca sativa TaxID=4236 RepID=A0A9R1V7I6_LACSA|nr:hypothetical protein LSAT_V11C600306120 [Lactuca sativa]